MFIKRNLLYLLLAVVAGTFQMGAASAQLQFNNQQNQGQGTGTFNAIGGPGQQFGGQQRFGGPQFGQQGQQGQLNRQGIGQAGRQQPAPGSAEAMRQAFQNMSGRERRRATFDFVVESLNEMRESRRRRDRRRRQPDRVNVRLRPAFNVTPVSSQQLGAALQSTLDESNRLEGNVSDARVSLEAGIATVTGTVGDEREAAILGRMLSLQPGVTQVVNELAVLSEVDSAPVSAETLIIPN